MRTILVTGATDGIGKETARVLVKQGARVLVHGRTSEKAERVARELKAEAVFGDLSSMAEVRALAAQIPAVDVVVHNAGVFMNSRTPTVDGFETTFAVNHLAPFLLTQLLLPSLRDRDDARVVVVSSVAHNTGRVDLNDLQMTRGYDGYRAYATSKLMNVLFAYEMARREPTIAFNALHPGVISTKLLRTGFGMGGAPLETGARTSVKVATDPALRGVTGKYFSDERETTSSGASHDRDLQRALYEKSLALAGLGQ
jgi:retinol dehydrogenase 14